MRRNIEGLKRNARLRSEGAVQRALAALHRMETSNREINFRSVAAEAGVSTAWLYNQQQLRDRIMRSRKLQTWAPSAHSETVGREVSSRKSVIATLRLRIKKLEEKTRDLTEQLERVYGEIAGRGHSASGTTSG